jgi:hypothetical protein
MTDMNKQTNGLEDAIKHALRRQEAPEDFTQRVIARVAAQNAAPQPTRNSWLSLFTQPIIRWAALAAVAAAMIFGVHIYQERRERAQGEAAKQRLMLALRVAGSKLQLAKAKVNEMNMNQIPPNIESLSSKAKETVEVTMDGPMLRWASKFLSADDPDEEKAAKLVANLKSIYVRSYEFDTDGAYPRADVDALRAQFRPPVWNS